MPDKEHTLLMFVLKSLRTLQNHGDQTAQLADDRVIDYDHRIRDLCLSTRIITLSCNCRMDECMDAILLTLNYFL